MTTIYDLKEHFQRYLMKKGLHDILFEKADRNPIAYLAHRLKISSWDEKTYIFEEVNRLNKEQEIFLDEMCEKFNLIRGKTKNEVYLTHALDADKIFDALCSINKS